LSFGSDDVEFDPSKLKLEGELDGAGAADLVEWVEAAVKAPCPQALRKRLGCLPEGPLIQHRIRVTKVWVIEDVEEVGPQLQFGSFGETKLAAE